MMACSQPFMREWAMVVASWAHQLKKRMEREGIKVSAATGGALRAAEDGTAGAPSPPEGAASGESPVDDVSASGAAAGGTVCAPPPPAGAAGGGSPVDDVSASGETATADEFKVIVVDHDADIFLVPDRRPPRGTFGDVPPAATDGASPPSTANGSDSAERASSAAAFASRTAPSAATSSLAGGLGPPGAGKVPAETTRPASVMLAAPVAPKEAASPAF